MDDDSVTFGSDTAGATPGSILAQPPLQGEDTPGEGAGKGSQLNPLDELQVTNKLYS